MIIVIMILIHIDDWRTEKDLKEQSREQNITSLIEKSTKLPIKSMVHGSS